MPDIRVIPPTRVETERKIELVEESKLKKKIRKKLLNVVKGFEHVPNAETE